MFIAPQESRIENQAKIHGSHGTERLHRVQGTTQQEHDHTFFFTVILIKVYGPRSMVACQAVTGEKMA